MEGVVAVPVEIPLDRICVNTGVLCPRCQRLVDSGVYNDLDVRMMRALLSVEKKLGSLRVKYVKAYRVDHKAVIIVDVGGGTLPAWLGRELQAALDDEEITSVVVLPSSGAGVKGLVEAAVHPYRVVDMTKVYTLDGSESYVVRLPRKARGKIDPGVLRIVLDILEKKYGARLYIEYVDVEEEEETVRISVDELKSVLDRIDRY